MLGGFDENNILDKKTDRQIDRQTDRQTDSETSRQAADRPAVRQSYQDASRHVCQKDIPNYRQSGI